MASHKANTRGGHDNLMHEGRRREGRERRMRRQADIDVMGLKDSRHTFESGYWLCFSALSLRNFCHSLVMEEPSMAAKARGGRSRVRTHRT